VISDLELEVTLELARVAREPRAEDRRRVLEALRRRMRQGSNGGSAGSRTSAEAATRVLVHWRVPSYH
jgi:hypothetical protein